MELRIKIFNSKEKKTQREKCPNTELFLACIFLYSVRIQENTDQKNSVFGHFSRSENMMKSIANDDDGVDDDVDRNEDKVTKRRY